MYKLAEIISEHNDKVIMFRCTKWNTLVQYTLALLQDKDRLDKLIDDLKSKNDELANTNIRIRGNITRILFELSVIDRLILRIY